MLLKAIAVYCRNLRELEVQLAMDATEEGLLALAGRSGQEKDQGFHRHWDSALYLHKDFGSAKEWYIKDALLFTPPCSTKRSLPPRQLDALPPTFPTGFGCLKLARFRISGDFIFPPMASRAKFNKYESGPVIEAGLYALLIHLTGLTKFTCGFTSLVLGRLRSVLPPSHLDRLRTPLQQLSLGWEEALQLEALEKTSHFSRQAHAFVEPPVQAAFVSADAGHPAASSRDPCGAESSRCSASTARLSSQTQHAPPSRHTQR